MGNYRNYFQGTLEKYGFPREIQGFIVFRFFEKRKDLPEMHLKYRNVNEAFSGIVRGIHSGSIPTVERPSRNGPVLVVEEPVTVTYLYPTERVLLNKARDANPFFHLFESLWMLAGRNDVKSLAYYASQIAEYSDDGTTLNGAYGRRWRYQFAVDQLEIIAKRLREKPWDRRAVLAMWSVEEDLLKIDESKDVCCNTHAYFYVEPGMCRECEGDDSSSCEACEGSPHDVPRYLSMTVCNRSNDLIWGLLGANLVHFSVLLEYMAAKVGLDVGVYNQFTNNLHVYTETCSGWTPEKWLEEERIRSMHSSPPREFDDYPIPLALVNTSIGNFDNELIQFNRVGWLGDYLEPWLERVAKPMTEAFYYYKSKLIGRALETIQRVGSRDWRVAGYEWLERRRKKAEILP